MINREQTRQVLEALAEEFLVDVPAEHDGKGNYRLDYFVLIGALIGADDDWVDRIVGYVNTKDVFGEVRV